MKNINELEFENFSQKQVKSILTKCCSSATVAPVVDSAILLIIAYLAFYVAEHWHLAGILSIVISMFMVNSFITKKSSEKPPALAVGM
jgi:NhaP-type Na+/H+ or K+/H+ antiporter